MRYNKISPIELKKRCEKGCCICILKRRNYCLYTLYVRRYVCDAFIEEWPYRMNFTMEHVQAVFEDRQLYGVYVNSVMVAVITALAGTLISYGGALVTARSTVSSRLKKVIDSIALVTNTIPGMVIGLAYLFCFSGTSLQNTFAILIICNMVHFFSTPYLMMKNSLSKMNASWETTAMLMGDNWTKTIIRVVNAKCSIHTAGGIQLLLRKCYGDDQCADLPCRDKDHGYYDKDQRITVFQQIQRNFCVVITDSIYKRCRQIHFPEAGRQKSKKGE
mgnify:CR=1 FL=1